MEIILPFFISLIITFLITPFVIKFANKYSLVDDPKTRPHPAHQHLNIVPRAGGLACFIGIIIPMLLFVPIEKHLLGIIIGMILMLSVGLADDKLKNLSPYSRLAVQFVAALIVVFTGVGISYITNPAGGVLKLDQLILPLNFLGQHHIILLADLFAIVWIVWMMNMVNWANGIDGQTPGFIAVASLILGLYSLNLYRLGDNNQLNIAILSFIVSGTSFGFLPHNWYPAKIFLGFSGTTILGFLLAVLAILSGAKLAIALIVLLVPAIDSIYTGLRRIISRKSPFYGDKKHLHHLLLNRGWSHQQISLFYILSCVILGLIAINLSSTEKLFTIIGVGILIFGTLIWLNSFGDSSEL